MTEVLKKLSFAFFFFLALVVLLSLDFPLGKGKTQEGKPSPKTIKAPYSLKVVDHKKTEALKDKAAREVAKVYRLDKNAEKSSKRDIKTFFEEVKTASTLEPPKQLLSLQKGVGGKISPDILGEYLKLPPSGLSLLEAEALQITEEVFKEKLGPQNLESLGEKLESLSLNLEPPRKNLVVVVAKAFIRPNYLYDSKATKVLKKEAAAKVKPVILEKMKGETIVQEGEIVSKSQAEFLKKLGLLGEKFEIRKTAGIIFFVLGIFVITGIYLFKYQPQVYQNSRLILLLGVVLLVVIFTGKVFLVFPSPYLTPVAAGGMLVTILFRPSLALVAVILTSLLTAVMVENTLAFLSVAILGGLLAIYLSSHLSRRSGLAATGLWLSLALAYLAFTISLVTKESLSQVFINSGWGFLSGLSSTILTAGALPFLEGTFNITTDLRLLELANPNHPLLHELMVKAPGTYNHSVTAGNLAEAGAKAIGANPILARVGAYYHDIGKIKRPLFFSENQTGVNPHDHTQPNLSYLIIATHVKEGGKLAKKYRLPQEIIQIIKEHHGTSVITYFFHQAKLNRTKENVSEINFRYSGNKPKRREAALVMLADSVEAMARLLAKPSPSRLEALVRKAIQGKLEDKQLDESSLTFNNLEKITKAFTQVLVSLYHSRIEYPESLNEAKKGKVLPLRGKFHGS